MIDSQHKMPNGMGVAQWTQPHQRTVRLRAVLAWSGLVLLAFAGMAIAMAGSMRAPDMMFLAGMYGSIGSLTLIGSAFHA
jgi:hypothetical protein